MKGMLEISDLGTFDSAEPFPSLYTVELLNRVQRAGRRLEKLTGTRWDIPSPSSFQDGALFTHTSTGSPSSPTSILFSKFGDLITTGRFGSPPYTHSSDQILSFIQILESDYKFRFVQPSILNLDYSGVLSRYKVGTWFQRFFCDVYWTAGKAHEGLLRWP